MGYNNNPTFGGLGTGSSFRANIEALQRIRFRMTALHDAKAPLTKVSLFKAVILVDGGIRSGSDVLKCLALGADAVLIGRPLVIGVFVGVKRVLA